MLANLTTPFKHPVAVPLWETLPPTPKKNPTSLMRGIFIAAFKTQQSFIIFPRTTRRSVSSNTPQKQEKPERKKWLNQSCSENLWQRLVLPCSTLVPSSHHFLKLGNVVRRVLGASVLSQKCHRALQSINLTLPSLALYTSPKFSSVLAGTRGCSSAG